MRSLLIRLKRLEEVRAAVERQRPLQVQCGYLKTLPPEYAGERRMVTVGRLPDGKYQWEERPGAPLDDENDDHILRVIFVRKLPTQMVCDWRVEPHPSAVRIAAERLENVSLARNKESSQ
jgi:hypothetical protein